MELEPCFDHVNPRQLRRAGRRREENGAEDRFHVCHSVFMLSFFMNSRLQKHRHQRVGGQILGCCSCRKLKGAPTNLQEKKFRRPINDWLRQFTASGCKNKERSKPKLSTGGTDFVL